MKYVFGIHYAMFMIELGCLLTLTFVLIFDNLSNAIDTEMLCSSSLSNSKLSTYFVLLCVMFRVTSVLLRMLCYQCCGVSGEGQWNSKRYQQFFQSFPFCGAHDDEKDDDRAADLYKQLGKMCAFFFVDDKLKLLPTDILAGLALIREKQLDRKRLLLREEEEETKQEEENVKNNDDVEKTLQSANEIFPFALSAYGWMVRVFGAACAGNNCCGGIVCQENSEEDDNAVLSTAATTGLVEHDRFGMNRRAIIATLKDHRQNAQLLYATYEDIAGSRVPYAIFVDWESRRVILSLRGTLSISDCITDLIAVEMRRKGKKRQRPSTITHDDDDNDDDMHMDSYMDSYGAATDKDVVQSNLTTYLSSVMESNVDNNEKKQDDDDIGLLQTQSTNTFLCDNVDEIGTSLFYFVRNKKNRNHKTKK